jgi:hypothetical protein
MRLAGTDWLKAGALAMAALACFAVSPAAAASSVCRQLEAQLTAASRGGNSARYVKYDRAVTAQREQLDLARSRARDGGCGFAFFGGRTGCGRINAQIDKMQRNLDFLQRTRAKLAGSGTPRERSRILARLDANGCRTDTARQAPPRRDERREILRKLLDGDDSRQDREEAIAARSNDDADRHIRHLVPDGRLTIGLAGERFRTVCVRTCDGYYFPMSPASTAVEFGRDQRNCESTCPGADVDLYYDRTFGEDPDAMMSVATGEPYSALSTAYLYKAVGTPRPTGCGCHPVRNFSVIAGEPAQADQPRELEEPSADAAAPVATTPSTVTFPAATPAQDEKPAGADVATPAPTASEKRPVRVVGPRFLPDPAEAIDLRAPDRKEVR